MADWNPYDRHVPGDGDDGSADGASAKPPSCQDCGAQPGQPHQDGCDTARCLQTGMQRLSCTMRHDCGDDIWTGQWPGEADCIRLGWYSKFTDRGWERCGPDDPDAGPDLNRLNPMSARWDKKTHRWEALDA